jgi:predicted ATPase
MLDESSVLTLTGPGGVGKTRIGLRLARTLLDRFEDGTWIVECGSLSDPSFLLPAVVSAVGLPDPAGRSLLSTIIDQLKGKRLLLVLDDCDPVLAAAADLAEGVVRACSSVRIVVTSREALGVPGEAILPIASLATPETRATVSPDELVSIDACRLFIDRARSVQPSFEVTEGNARSVAQLCRRLDGIPLAIELAAARVRALPVEQVAARLDDRFRLLTGGSRTSVARHQTLRATIDWSYDLLTEPERAVLRRLSVFAGGASLEAAEAVCAGDPVDTLDGRHLIAGHGSRDKITSARMTRAYVDRASRTAASAEFVDMGRLGHYMLHKPREWNRFAVRSTLEVLDLAVPTQAHEECLDRRDS